METPLGEGSAPLDRPDDRALLMIPGPIELSPAVLEAAAAPPPSHVAPDLIAAFGRALTAMHAVWRAPEGAEAFVVAGSGTLAMEAAACNLLDPGEPALVVDTGYFGARMAEMLARRGADVASVVAEPGTTVAPDVVAASLEERPAKVVCITHVDTSTGVRTDIAPIAAVAREYGALVVVDGVCSTVGERLDMAADGVDLFLTGSQKAIGAPPGLALLVLSQRALAARAGLETLPPLYVDVESWRPVMDAYREGRPSYFATPATSLIAALDVALQEIVDDEHAGQTGVAAAWARHQQVADALRGAWRALGLELLPASEGIAANTLSALRYPEGVDATLVKRIGARGVAVAGGLHPKLKAEYFRVGHMGYTTTRGDWLVQTVTAIGEALQESGHAVDLDGALDALGAVA